jgi:predicted RNA-binding Zn-ribbon protein involved in translation (DUF1610 family)
MMQRPVPGMHGMMRMQGERRAAQTVRCRQCGGTIRIAESATEVVCPTCKATTPVDAAWFDAAADYGRNVEGLRGELERRRRALGPKQSEQSVSMLPFILVIGGIMVTGIAGTVVGQRIVAEGMTDTNWMLLGGCIAFLVVVIVIAAIATRAPARDDAGRGQPSKAGEMLGPQSVQCQSCGAHTEVDLGKAGVTCSHCGSPVSVSAEEMRRIVWSASLEARTEAAKLRPPSPFWNALGGYGACLGRFRPMQNPWPQLPPLASSLSGEIGLEHLQRWMHGYWPEGVPPELLAHLGGFVWGHHRGYPVAVGLASLTGPTRSPEDEWSTRDQYVHALGHHDGGIGWPRVSLLVFVAAVAIPEHDVTKLPGLFLYRTSAGYVGLASFEHGRATVEALWQYVDQLCARAEHDGSPPAPFIDPAAPAWNERGGVA